jgi:hypothetical protein
LFSNLQFIEIIHKPFYALRQRLYALSLGAEPNPVLIFCTPFAFIAGFAETFCMYGLPAFTIFPLALADRAISS